jgi:hypothetical protein
VTPDVAVAASQIVVIVAAVARLRAGDRLPAPVLQPLGNKLILQAFGNKLIRWLFGNKLARAGSGRHTLAVPARAGKVRSFSLGAGRNLLQKL